MKLFGMNQKQIGAAIFVLGGLVLLAGGILNLLDNRSDTQTDPEAVVEEPVVAAEEQSEDPGEVEAVETTPTATEETAPSTEPSTSTTQPTTTTTTTTSVPDETPEAFLALLVDGLRGDVDFLISRLNQATIAIYGEEQCRAALAGSLDPETELEIREIGATGPWDYVIDDITTPIADATPVEVQRFVQGQTLIQELHWQLLDGQWTWFSDCGEPLTG